MLRKNKAFTLTIAWVLIGFTAIAQNNNTTSPYSRFGLGDLQHYSFGRFAGMGGASLGSRHNTQINSSNPASFNANDSMSVNFDFGVDARLSNFESNSGSMSKNDVNFRYFSLSWPVTSWLGMAIGLQPFSDMGYDIQYQENLPGIGKVFHNYQGEGSTSKAFFGVGFSPIKRLSLGANLNYIFGRLSQNTAVSFANDDLFYLYETEGSRLRDFKLTYGLQYDIPVKKGHFLTLGVTFENQTEITALHRLFTYKGITINSSSLSDTLRYVTEVKDIIKLPSTFGIGLSYSKPDKIEINADYYHSSWDKATFYGEKNNLLVNQSRMSAGIEYIPDALSIRNYFQRVRYRAGVHQENSYLKLNDQQIKEFGISFGVGLPITKTKSTANIAFELGTKGTKKDNLVKENYAKISIYLNLYDYWFVKRKFD